MKRIFIIIWIALFFYGCNENKTHEDEGISGKPKNVILMIGDGMGLAQVSAAYSIKKDQMNMVRCEYTGMVNTSSSDKLITDSGAAGTALATGQKTNNLSISVDTAGIALKTIIEIAEDNNMATGMVTSCGITHATPAAFIAHQTSRHDYEAIAYDFLSTDIDVFIGGSRNHFMLREDSLNLLDSLLARDYIVATEISDLESIKQGKLAGLVYENHPPKYSDGRSDFLEIASMKAIDLLRQNDNGFFLMIEASQIDWAGHDNDFEYLLDETIDFDNVIGSVLDFARKDGNTLVIITADHETGGFALLDGNLEEGLTKAGFASDYHTPIMVPLFAEGPGAESFSGVYENTAIFDKICEALGFIE